MSAVPGWGFSSGGGHFGFGGGAHSRGGRVIGFPHSHTVVGCTVTSP